ncbi:MAG: bL35 family ribosomal protein [Patescibacteria group bacterium]|nr:50S ribosomal protein L35 [Patescibacteria group bacterium]MDP4030803.1 bL35 family ribosomal protein [Candidatus Beckwithbacteria bacterium]MDZ4229261.1 bL35 family ribosomal protein [Patescibacteria group bacterium]
MKKKNPKIKIKTRKSVSKRFKITKGGVVLRRSGQIRHLRANRSKRNLRRGKVPKVANQTLAKKIKRMMVR